MLFRSNLPAGAVGFAAVAQVGRQSWENPTDQRVVNGLFWGLTGTQGEGERTNEAVAVEFRVPLLSKLTASVSGRYDRYTNEGLNSDSDPTYKVGLEFRPIESLLIRGNVATAFKAPDMAYVFAGNSGFYTSVTDYYRCATEEPGVPLEDCSTNDEQVFGNRAGSPTLESITARSSGLGVVWSPSPNFDMSADYYHIKIDNKVSDLSLDNLLQTESACRLGQLDPSSPSCVDALARISRAGPAAPEPNQLTGVQINPINISTEEIKGITAKLNYRLPTDSWGTFGLNLDYNVTLDHLSQQYPQDPLLDLLNEPFYSSEFPNVGSATVTWEKGHWTNSLHATRYGRTPNFLAQVNEAGYDVPGTKKVSAQMLVNGTVGYDFNDDISLMFTVNNLFNKMAPSDPTWTDYPYYNIFNYNGYGRSYMLEINWRFGASSQ